MNMAREYILQAEVTALRVKLDLVEKELARFTAWPLPSLQMYGDDVADVAAAIQRRGVHPSEWQWLAQYILDLDACGMAEMELEE